MLFHPIGYFAQNILPPHAQHLRFNSNSITLVKPPKLLGRVSHLFVTLLSQWDTYIKAFIRMHYVFAMSFILIISVFSKRGRK